MKKSKKVNKNCGSRLKTARKKQKLTQRELAELVGVDDKYISALENDRGNMSVDLAIRFSSVLSIRAEYLLGIDDHETSYDHVISREYSNQDMFSYLEIMERYGYVISTPFGPDGDTAFLSFMKYFNDDVVIAHEKDHYKCTPDQFKHFLRSTTEAIDKIKISMVQQFLSNACISINDDDFNELMDAMKDHLNSIAGTAAADWLSEQKKIDEGRLDEVDRDKWGKGMIGISQESAEEVLRYLGPEKFSYFIQHAVKHKDK